MAKKISSMTLFELQVARISTLESINKASGVAKKDLLKHLGKLNDEIGRRRKLCS